MNSDWILLAIPLAVLAFVLLAGWAAKRLLFRSLFRIATRAQSQVGDLLLRSLGRPFMAWILILAIYLAVNFSHLPPQITAVIDKALLILWVLSLTTAAAGLAVTMIRFYGRRLQGALPVTSLTEHLAKLTVTIIGLLILLNLLGISIVPILTALGVGGLAVALALQDTLANLFAGVYVSAAGHIRVGDYIKLEGGEEGYVSDISWRSTTVRALQNNLIIVPNSKLAQSIITNYHLPEKRMSLLIPVSVSYGSDPEEVEQALVDEALRGAADIPGLLADPAPFVRFIPGFGEFSLNFTLICQVSEFVDQYLVQHVLRKRIIKRFHQEGIEIPFPTRTVHVQLKSKTGASASEGRKG